MYNEWANLLKWPGYPQSTTLLEKAVSRSLHMRAFTINESLCVKPRVLPWNLGSAWSIGWARWRRLSPLKILHQPCFQGYGGWTGFFSLFSPPTW